MSKWNMIVDVAECHNCNNCFLSCKDEYVGNDFEGYSASQPLHGHKWINIKTKERGSYPVGDVVYVPTMCNHCDDAPCIKAGKGAVSKREDGIVIIDPVKAKGKREIVDSCPWEAIWWNEKLELPQAWTFDAHLLDRGWKEPRASQVCPTGALRSLKVTDEEMQKIIEVEKLEPLSPEYQTKPRVHYKNLFRYNRLFIAGSVLTKVNDTLECVNDATVTLSQDGEEVSVTYTDAFGEYRFDDLALNSGNYEIHITHSDYTDEKITAVLEDVSIVVPTVNI